MELLLKDEVYAVVGAAYGPEAIPGRRRLALRGEWPIRSVDVWRGADVEGLAEEPAQRR